MQAMTFPQAETFVKEVVTALHGASTAPVTVGSAAVKWAKAWSKVGLDYYDFHWYGWVDQYFPHTKTPTDYKVDDKQVMVGEFPLNPGSDPNGSPSAASPTASSSTISWPRATPVPRAGRFPIPRTRPSAGRPARPT